MNGFLLRVVPLLTVLLAGWLVPATAETIVRIGYPLAINAEIPITMRKASIDRKHGFAGEFTTFQNGAPMFEALASNSLDVIVTSIMPTLVYLSKLPNDFRIIAAPGESSSALLVRPQSTIRSMSDLKGKRIGVSFGSSQHLDLLRSLEQNGLDKNEVTLLNMQPADLPLALEENLADAIVAFQPQIVKLKNDMGARSIEALRNGRKEFSPEERARVELSRFRCFLLGLPEALLGTTPEEITGLMLTRHATLRKSFDDATCGVLVRGTMAAKLSNDNSFGGRLSRRLEMGFSKAFFVRNFTDGDPAKAAKIGVPLTAADRFFAVVTALLIFPKMFAYDAASEVGFLRDGADQRLIRKIEHLLRSYGHADFASDGTKYKPAHA
jgi:ABC-type nitrate/sulfonate/bicarbonate transport system substrate-binding protein